MDNSILIEIIKIIPNTLIFVLGIILIIIFGKPIRDLITSNLLEFKGFGLELKFISESIQSLNLNKDLSSVINRAKSIQRLCRGVNILWVDGRIGFNIQEIYVLKALGIKVDVVDSTQKVISKVEKDKYSIIISNMNRQENPHEGIDMLNNLNNIGKKIPVIFYVGKLDESKGTPPYAFAITSKADELIHYIFDIIERIKN